MINKQRAIKTLNQFEDHYQYDCTYMHEMLEASPEAFGAFEGFIPMGRFQDKIPTDVLYVANIATMKSEDCGACTQLNIRMAIEAGVPTDIIKAAIKDPQQLPPDLKDIYDFAVAVASNGPITSGVHQQLEQKFSKQVMVELALAIASTKVYPTIKRALNHGGSCALYRFEFGTH